MKRIYLVITILLASHYSFAQSDTFGNVSVEELSMKTYEKDTNAIAVILFEKGSAKVESTLGTKVKKHIRIKILTKEGLDLANVKLVPNNTSIITKVTGATYNLENGTIKRYDVADTLILKTNRTKKIMTKSFALPNVRVGSVIEYEYTERGADFYLPNWAFQHHIPCITSEYEVYTPSASFITHMMGTLEPSNHETKYDNKYQKWTMNDIPAFKSEPLMPDEGVYISTIEFASDAGWHQIHNSLIKSSSFGGVAFYNNSNYFKKEMELIKAMAGDEAKIMAIVDLVKKNIEWNGVRDFYADPPEDVIRKKTGSSGDINLLLANLLKKAGYNVNMLLLSTKDHGLVLKDFTSKWQFNYVICLLELADKDFLLDATERLLPYNLLPERCYNYDAMLVSEAELDWVKIAPGKEKVFVSGNFTLTQDGELNGTFNYSNFECSAFDARKLHQSTEEDAYNKTLFNENNWTVKKTKTEGLDDIDKPLIEDFEVTIPDLGTNSGELIYFNPIIFFKIENTPFSLETRNYPIDLGLPHEQTVTMSITIPDNFAIEELPKNQILSLPNNGAKYIFSVTGAGNKVQVTTKFQLNQTFFTPEEYISLKEFYKRLVSKHAETVVLKKIK